MLAFIMEETSPLPRSRFIDVMEKVRALAEAHPQVPLDDFFKVMGVEGPAVLLIFLCLPYMQPIPIPGLSTPFGILIALVSFFLLKNQPATLPRRFHKLKLSSKLLLKIVLVAEKIWSRVHRRIFARGEFLFTHPFFKFLSFFVVALNGLLLALPLPIPFSNTIPAIAILLNSLGQMERDGLFVILSYVATTLCLGFFVILGYAAFWSLQIF